MKRTTNETSDALFALLASLGHRAERYDRIEMSLGSALLSDTRRVVIEAYGDNSDPALYWEIKIDDGANENR